MHEGQLDVSETLVRRLLRAQLPALADEQIRPVVSTGTVNALFRVGDDALVRAPIMPTWGDAVAEAGTLRLVAPRLPVRVPSVLLVGRPDAGYARHWLVLDWIEGAPAVPGAGGTVLADDLVGLLHALWSVPAEEAREGYRVDLGRHDTAVRESLAAASDLVDVPMLTEAWEDALRAAPWQGAPRWTHADLLAGNVLLGADGRLLAVLDWEAAGVADPACDLMAAWSLLDAGGRRRMRDQLGLDDDAWQRGRGWALLQAAIALPYYRETSPGLVAHSLHVLRELTRAARAAR